MFRISRLTAVFLSSLVLLVTLPSRNAIADETTARLERLMASCPATCHNLRLLTHSVQVSGRLIVINHKEAGKDDASFEFHLDDVEFSSFDDNYCQPRERVNIVCRSGLSCVALKSSGRLIERIGRYTIQACNPQVRAEIMTLLNRFKSGR